MATIRYTIVEGKLFDYLIYVKHTFSTFLCATMWQLINKIAPIGLQYSQKGRSPVLADATEQC